MAAKNKGAVFRISGLLARKSDEAVEIDLRRIITENLSDVEAKFRFTTAIVPSCNDDARRVALVEFHDGVPKFLHALMANPLGGWQIGTSHGDINFDRHFFGFTQLYTPNPKTPITAE